MKNLRKIGLLMGCGFILIFSSCTEDTDNALTIVKGKITNKYTGDAIPNIPIEILKCSDGLNIEGPQCDSLTAVYSDNDGNYEMSFRTKRCFHYQVGALYTEWFQGSPISSDSAMIKEGIASTFDIKLAPFKILEVDVNTSKGSKNYVHIEYQGGTNDGWIGGTILLDTSRVNQNIDKNVYVKVYPNGTYWIYKTLCSRRGQDYQYVYQDCEYAKKEVAVEFADTTKIIVN